VQASSSGNYIAKEALKNSFVQQSLSKSQYSGEFCLLNLQHLDKVLLFNDTIKSLFILLFNLDKLNQLLLTIHRNKYTKVVATVAMHKEANKIS